MTKITEIQIVPIKPRDGLVAFGSVVIDDAIYLGSIGIHTRLDGSGYRITYPTKLTGNRNLNLFHPISREASAAIEDAVIAKFEEVMKGNNDYTDYAF